MHNKKIRLALAGLLIVAASYAAAQGRVSGVSVSKLPSGVEVTVQGSQLNEPKGKFIESDCIYTLEFDVPYSGKQEKTQVWMNGLETMTTTAKASKSPKTRLTFKFTKGVLATISKFDKGYKVDFVPNDAKVATKTTKGKKQGMVAMRSANGMDTLGHFLPLPAAMALVTKTSTPDMPFMISNPILANATLPGNPTVQTAAQGFAVDPAPKPVDPKPTKSDETKTGDPKATYSKPAAEPKASEPKAPAEPKAVATKASGTVRKVTGTNGEPRVSIDFVNTEVVQILKSLARQTGTNIVTSPDVSGKLSIRLDDVSVRESLTLVTSLAGLKFGQVGKTYLVTSPAKFVETLRNVQGTTEDMTMSRIVPIFSGQGTQIKVAVLKSVSSENAFGRFELVLPSEKTVVSATQKMGADKKDDDKGGTNIATESNDTARDSYVMVLGSPGRLDEVESLVANIDRQLCTALGVRVPTSNATSIETYFVHGGRASDLVEAIAGKGKSTVGSVELFSTPTNSIAKQSIVLKGRADEVQNVLRAISQLDSDETAIASEFKMVDLMYADPRTVRELVVANVPGVTCVLAPNGVMNSKTYVQDAARNQSEQRGTDQPAPQGGGTGNVAGQNGTQSQGTQGAGGTGSDVKQGKDNADSGLTLPFDDFEKVAVPMRLIVKGSHDQVLRAMEWIQATDIAPKQVALEMRVMELSREELLKMGIDWNLFTSGAIKTIKLNNGQSSPSNKIGVTVQGKDVSGDVAASLDSISNGSNLISRPNLLCNDGRESEAFVGDALRYVESITSSQNGTSVTTGTVRTGVRLACLPRIGGNNILNLDIRTAITFLKGYKTVPQIGGELPQTSERTAQNTITLNDGETFAIGGLIQQQDVVEMSGLPILKDLPILGQFFRRTTKDKIKTELVIFVTAKVVGPGAHTNGLPMSKDSDIMKRKTTLPGGRG